MKLWGERKKGKMFFSQKGLETWDCRVDVADDEAPEKISEWFEKNWGRAMPGCPDFSWVATDMYRTKEGREKMEGWFFSAAPAPEVVVEKKKLTSRLVMASCGHETAEGLMMSTSSGSSCPACYDRMSC